MSTFTLHLQRVRLRAELATLEAADVENPEEIGRVRSELSALEDALVTARVATSRDARLARALDLGADELDFVWAVVARAADPHLLPHLRLLAGSDAKKGLSLAHHVAIAGVDHARAQKLVTALSPSHPLRRHDVLIPAENDEADVCTPLTVPPRVWSYLLGGDEPDELLSLAGGEVGVPGDAIHDEAQAKALDRLASLVGGKDPIVILIEGPVGSGRRTAVAAAARRAGKAVFGLDAGRVSAQELGPTLTALRRECLLRDAVPLVAEVDELVAREGEQGSRLQTLSRALERVHGPVAVTSSVRGLDLGVRNRRLIRITWPVPTTAARRKLWEHALGADAARLDGELDGVALRYRLGAGGIRAAASAARLLADPRPPEARDLVEGVRNNIAERLGELAQRVEVKQTWDDLVLPQDTLDDVKALMARIRHAHQVYERWGFHAKMPRGIGVAALFSGPPGTGKTMVAGLIARELDLELYQIDLSKVVSKWVGETEKQLSKIFDAADAGHALLLFDEADSLFAKRTEVKSAVDRYANLEVNYLLQRIESFGGITILTTNLDTSIDPALRRRLASHIVFNAPEQAECIRLWERMLQAEAPIEDPLDFEALSETYNAMTGANIRNAVLSAAFMAASEGSAIAQRHLERAARGEYRAMGRVLG